MKLFFSRFYTLERMYVLYIVIVVSILLLCMCLRIFVVLDHLSERLIGELIGYSGPSSSCICASLVEIRLKVYVRMQTRSYAETDEIRSKNDMSSSLVVMT